MTLSSRPPLIRSSTTDFKRLHARCNVHKSLFKNVIENSISITKRTINHAEEITSHSNTYDAKGTMIANPFIIEHFAKYKTQEDHEFYREKLLKQNRILTVTAETMSLQIHKNSLNEELGIDQIQKQIPNFSEKIIFKSDTSS
jgi:hypothetical protein